MTTPYDAWWQSEGGIQRMPYQPGGVLSPTVGVEQAEIAHEAVQKVLNVPETQSWLRGTGIVVDARGSRIIGVAVAPESKGNIRLPHEVNGVPVFVDGGEIVSKMAPPPKGHLHATGAEPTVESYDDWWQTAGGPVGVPYAPGGVMVAPASYPKAEGVRAQLARYFPPGTTATVAADRRGSYGVRVRSMNPIMLPVLVQGVTVSLQ